MQLVLISIAWFITHFIVVSNVLPTLLTVTGHLLKTRSARGQVTWAGHVGSTWAGLVGSTWAGLVGSRWAGLVGST